MRPPPHLSTRSKAWFKSVMADWDLQEHHVHLLTLACEALDRCDEARKAIGEHGLTYDDTAGMPKSRPEVVIERDSRLAFARLCRELALDEAEPDVGVRPPRLTSSARRKGRFG